MALKTFVKISGVNNLSDARYCAGMAVDVIGFNIDPLDENYNDPEKFKAITEWLSGVSFAGEFTMSDITTIKKQINEYNIQYLQIKDPSLLKNLQTLNIPVILQIEGSEWDNLGDLANLFKENSQYVHYFLIECEGSITDPEFQSDLLKLSDQFPILMGFEITDNNVNALIENSNIAGIALKGGEEIKPGYKDFDELADILEAIEIDDLQE